MITITSTVQDLTAGILDELTNRYYQMKQVPPSRVTGMPHDEFRKAMAEDIKENPLELEYITEVLGTKTLDFYLDGDYAIVKVGFWTEESFNIAIKPDELEQTGTPFSIDMNDLTIMLKINANEVPFIEMVRNLTLEHIESRKDEPEIAKLIADAEARLA